MEKNISAKKTIIEERPAGFLLSTASCKKGPVCVIAENGQAYIYGTLLLKGERILVCRFKDAGEAVRAEAELVLLDCGFDAERGVRILRELKGGRPDLPIMFITEDGSKEAALEAFRAGARDFIEKPFDIMELRRKIEDFLAIKRASRERRFPFSLESPSRPAPASAGTDKPLSVLRAIQYIKENLSEKIRLHALARQAGMSKFHFCRLFVKHTGMSPMKYVTYLRIELAKRHLERGDSTVSLLALDMGFNDLGTFIRQFKRHAGCTPTAYQESLRGTPQVLDR